MIFRNPASAVDLIVERKEEILLIKRRDYPYEDCWAIPGGFLDYNKETLENAAVRELKEETSLVVKEKDLRLLGVYSEPTRDPRDHVISHVYIVDKYSGNLRAADDASDVKFFSLDSLPSLAFDHHRIIKEYLRCNK